MSDKSPETTAESKSAATDALPSGANRTLVKTVNSIVMVIAVGLSIYQLYTAGITALTALVQRAIHLGAILSLTFLVKPPFKGARKDRLTVILT